jgi:RNA polymerase sigma factor for flagellar operon FliA
MPPSIRLYEETCDRGEALILEHLGMVKRIAVHLKARIPPFMEASGHDRLNRSCTIV